MTTVIGWVALTVLLTGILCAVYLIIRKHSPDLWLVVSVIASLLFLFSVAHPIR